MDIIAKLAKGVAAARAALGSDPAGPSSAIALEAGGTLNVEPRRKKPEGQIVVRLETPLGEGLARIDLSPADAHALATLLTAFADQAAADAAKPVQIERKSET